MIKKYADILSSIISTIVDLTLLTIGVVVGFLILPFIVHVFYRTHSLDILNTIFIACGLVVYFSHLFRRMKNPHLFEEPKDLRDKFYMEISYFGMSFSLVALIFSLALSFLQLLDLHAVNVNKDSIIFLITKAIYELSPKFLLPSLIILIGFPCITLAFVAIFIFLKKSFRVNNLIIFITILLLYFTVLAIFFFFLPSVMDKLMENRMFIEASRLIIGFPALGFFRLLFYGKRVKNIREYFQEVKK